MTDEQRVKELLLQLARTNRELADAAETKQKLTQELLEHMQGPVHFVDATGKHRRGFAVAPERITIDPGLLDDLPAEVADEVTKKSVDRAAVEAAAAAGRITSEQLVKYTRITPVQPHVRIVDEDEE